ncbi:binuclear zinc transcription factor [Verticillium dahliae VdLs.17]|uniref:Binuclear zinc transcription factor n=1 Tax=Verticillium dahliae (strain VdLs.17 / ATCC MYA-4575 / FGSC 10137) TaxID=498257 RepID=G2WXQ1_VERDV|nr:binuclear zinc transcription factor [Verticillium dahliae VdLs.17]EGY20859.1 binuclear zinc transcription factor [Verticillium dahliae VdLs.17]
MPPQDEEATHFSCTQCRSMKLKCDRIRPRCSRCARVSADCEYPQSRRANVGRRRRVRELEAKLVELERLAKLVDKSPGNGEATNQDTATQNTDSMHGSSEILSDLPGPASDANVFPVDAPSAELASTGTYEQRPSLEMVEHLTNSYFDKWHYTAPMLQRTRYSMSLSLPTHMRPPMCLQYIVMAWGAEIGNTHRHLAMPFYNRAREYAQGDEMKASLTLAHAQTWCLMCYFEAQYLLFSRSSMSICRAIRIAQMLGLHQVDGDGLDHTSLIPPPQSWLEAEERRRTWWALYCSDRIVGGTAGWPVLIDEADISVRLPASEAAFENGAEEMTSPLTTMRQQEGQMFSSFAGRVLAASLFHQAFQHSTLTLSDDSSQDPRTRMHWKRHREIDDDLVILLQALPDGLRLPRQIRCRNAIFVNIIIHMSVICLHRAAISKIKAFGLPESTIRSSRARLVCSAEEILIIFRMMSDINENLKNSILTFAVYLAAQVFLEDLEPTEKDDSQQDNLDFILRIMILSFKTLHNPVSGSMAVQVALEMRQRGLDSPAVEKATELLLSHRLTPVFTKGGTQSSGPVFRLPSNSEA